MIELLEHDGAQFSASASADADNPVFEGHYPGFPILPGLFLVEYAHETVRAVLGEPDLWPVAVDRVRFLRPVYPGDELRIEGKLTEDGGTTLGQVTVHVLGKPVAEIRLRYPGGTR